MSFTNSGEHSGPVGPDDPLSTAPRPLPGEPELQPDVKQARSDHLCRSRFDEMREEAFARSNRHPLEFQLARERRSRLLPAIAGAIAAAIGITVVAALVFFNVLPKLKSDPSLAVSISTPASATAAPSTPTDTEALLQGFVRFRQSNENDRPGLVSSEPDVTGTAKVPGNSQALLDKFMQWQQRTPAAQKR